MLNSMQEKENNENNNLGSHVVYMLGRRLTVRVRNEKKIGTRFNVLFCLYQ